MFKQNIFEFISENRVPENEQFAGKSPAEYFWNLVMKVEFMKMSTLQEKAQCVSWFLETKSDIQAQ